MTKKVFTRAEAETMRATLNEMIDKLPKPERKALLAKINRLGRFLDAAIEVAPSPGETLEKVLDSKRKRG